MEVARVSIGRVRQKDSQRLALRALSKLLKAHPKADKASVVWLSLGESNRARRSSMSFRRAEHLLLIEWADGGTRTIPTGDEGVHHFASIGRIDRFGASS